MVYIIIILVLAFLTGNLFMLMPSEHERKAMSNRLRAGKLGINVVPVPPDDKLVLHYIRDSNNHRKLVLYFLKSAKYEGGVGKKLSGLVPVASRDGQGDLRLVIDINPEEAQTLNDQLSGFSETVFAFFWDERGQVCVLWDEQGGEDAVIQLHDILTTILQRGPVWFCMPSADH